jgi:hypothetical protein
MLYRGINILHGMHACVIFVKLQHGGVDINDHNYCPTREELAKQSEASVINSLRARATRYFYISLSIKVIRIMLLFIHHRIAVDV